MEINDILNILSLTQSEIDALGTLDSGSMVYNSTTNALEVYNGTTWDAASGIFTITGSNSSTTNNLQITGSLTVSSSIVDFTKATAISGSVFSGSFVGDGSALSGISGGGGSGIFALTGSSQNTTNNLQITGSLTITGSVVDFTKATAISGSVFSGSFVGDGADGYEGFIVPTKVWPFQVMGFAGGDNLQARELGTRPNSSVTSPIMFQQDVNLISVSANVVAPTNDVTGYVGIYELVSKATTGSANYYEYNKLHQLTSTINWVNGASAGEQTLTLSTPFKFLAGKVYVVTTVNNYGAGTQPQLHGLRRLGFNKLLSNTPVTSTSGYNTEYALQLSDSFSYGYDFAFASAGVLPNTIWFQGVTTQTNSSNVLSLTLQNA